MFQMSRVRNPAPYTERKKQSANVNCTSLLDVVNHLFVSIRISTHCQSFLTAFGSSSFFTLFFIAAAAAAKVTDFVEYETNLKRD